MLLEISLAISRVVGLFVVFYAIGNGILAMVRVQDPPLRYGRIAIGIAGFGMLLGKAERLLADRQPDLVPWLQAIGVMLMLVGTVRLVRLYRRFPEAKSRTLNLFGWSR